MDSKDYSPIFPEEQPQPKQPEMEWLHSEKDGLLNVPAESEDAAESQWMREHHNASHALWYFSMIVYAIVHGKAYQNTRQKTERILAHMAHLREFVMEHETQGLKIINQLFDVLMSEKPSGPSEWTHFIYAHWSLIWRFAERYGHHDKCFPERDRLKIRDIVERRCWMRRWWWQDRLKDLKKFFTAQLRRMRGRP